MSNWIDEEAKKYLAAKELKEQKADLMLRSNYWADIKVQVLKDVEQINNHPVWKEVLGIAPLKIVEFNNDYEIRKEILPEVSVLVHSDYLETLEVTTTRKMIKEIERYSKKETLKLDSDGTKVYLKSGDTTFCIPKEVSKHILKPFIDAMKSLADN